MLKATRVPYSAGWYEAEDYMALRSAREVCRLVVDLLHPTSVIDVGCGVGAWLHVLQGLGVERGLGVEGSWVQHASLRIRKESLRVHDLRTPLHVDERYDLALCLEVAEHLPAAAAPVLTQSLVNAAPAILFSAAIPGQGGTNHINEQWPDYWAALFAAHGYEPVDVIRPAIWNNANVDAFYRQNILLFADSEYLESHPHLTQLSGARRPCMLSVVHPEIYTIARRPAIRRFASRLLATLPPAAAVWRRARVRREPRSRLT